MTSLRDLGNCGILSPVFCSLALLFPASPVLGASIFEDGFETGTLSPAWTVSATVNGRASASQLNGPATGAWHLILDDSVNDALYSVAEATAGIDLQCKKNVVLTFKAKSLGNEPNAPPGGNFASTSRSFDGVSISTNGGTTWRAVQSLATVGTEWEAFTIPLDDPVAQLGGGFGTGFLIRFSAYDNSSAPLDGIAIDGVSVTADDDQRVMLELPSPVIEGSGPHTGWVLLAFAPSADLVVNLAFAPVTQLVVPAVVTVSAGQSFASFDFLVSNDDSINPSRTVTVTPDAPNTTATASTLTIYDDEPAPVASLSLPAQLAEGVSPTNNASILLDIAATVSTTFVLTANPASEVTLPPTVTVPAGQKQVDFTAKATNDTLLDGNIPVAITATSLPIEPTTALTTTIDNEIPALSLTLPSTVLEGATTTGTVTMSGALGVDLVVGLSSSSTDCSLPLTVTIPAGLTSISFQVATVNDALINLSRKVTISAAGTGVSATSQILTILDDETPPVATLTLPASLAEGTSPTMNATLSLDVAATADLTMSLTANPTGEVSLPSSVTVPAGTTQVVFTAQAVNDTRIDGDILVEVTASSSSVASVTAQTTAVDNETRSLSLTLPATLQEGTSGSGTVSIPGTLTTQLTVTLTNPNSTALSIPTFVTIPVGQVSAAFTVTAVDNLLQDGSRSVTLGAAAATFSSASKQMIVRDDEVASYRFSTLTNIVNHSSPVNITLSALDMEGNVINGFAGIVNLSVVLPDGTTQAPSPSVVTLAGANGWTGNITLPTDSFLEKHLRAVDANGIAGESTPFDMMRVLELKTGDLIWDATRSRIYASMPDTAGETYANKVVAIDPVTMSITGSVTTYQNPGQLALTSDDSALYVALNGNGTIAKIDLAAFAVVSTFAVGTDSLYGTLYAEDICTVAGQPDLLVISQYRKGFMPRHNGVAAYDNGVRRPTQTQNHTGSNVIESSADPAVFFGYNNESSEFGFRRLQLSANGMTQLAVNGNLLSSNNDIRSDGDKVFSNSGVVLDGALMKRLGVFPVTGVVRPDLAANRVYFIEPQSYSTYYYDKIGAYDPTTFSSIRRLTLPSTEMTPASFIRWGVNGLAFRTATAVKLINSSRLVPSDSPTDLAVIVQAAPNSATAGVPLTYTVQLTNQGPNMARNTLLEAILSDSQTITNVVASTGTATISGFNISLPVGNLAAGAAVTLTITTTPQSAGSLTCAAGAISNAMDSDFTNNNGFQFVSVGFESVLNVVNQLRLTANNLIHDPTRNLLWAGIPSTVAAPLGKSIVSINPSNGLIEHRIPLNGDAYPKSIALSGNGRYLYVGLSNVAEVVRMDLTTTPVTSVHIPLGLNQLNGVGYAQDIEPLDGDGTSFLVTTTGDSGAAVFDDSVRRATRSGIFITVDRIERTATSGVFIGYCNASSGYYLSKLLVTASGVTIDQTVSSVISGYGVEIEGDGNLVLSSTGLLVDSSTLTLKSNLGLSGCPCLDGPYGRAFIVNGNTLRSYDTATGNPIGTLALPVTATGDWAQACVRWGPDGYAILGNDAKIYITRTDWSLSVPEIAVEQPTGTNIDDDGSKVFANTTVGTNRSLVFTVKNTGSGNLTGLAVTRDGPHAADFTITSNPVAQVAPGANTTFTVRFAPTTNGKKTAVLHIASNDVDENPYDITLTGWGIGGAPEIAVQQPAGINIADGGSKVFPNTPVGTGVNVTFTIQNTGTANLTGLTSTKNSANASDFTVIANPEALVAPGANTTFTVRFAPTTNGKKTAVLHIASNDADENPFDIALTGWGIGGVPDIAVQQPAGTNIADGGSKVFPNTTVGTNRSLVFTIRNTGTGNLTGLSITKFGDDASDFAITLNPAATVAPGANTTFTVRFAPSGTGPRAAAIRVASNDADENPYVITLTGWGLAAVAGNAEASDLWADFTARDRDRDSWKTIITVDPSTGLKYRTLVVAKSPGSEHRRRIVEVSPNLLDWYSGRIHTTVMKNTPSVLKVRDNTPVTPEEQRYIRLKTCRE